MVVDKRNELEHLNWNISLFEMYEPVTYYYCDTTFETETRFECEGRLIQ